MHFDKLLNFRLTSFKDWILGVKNGILFTSVLIKRCNYVDKSFNNTDLIIRNRRNCKIMPHCIGPRWIKEKLIDLGLKGIKVQKLKKFQGYHYLVQSTVLRIAENIGRVIGFRNVTVEPALPSGDADIKFVDSDVHYVQVKSPLFFASKYGDRFSEVSKEFSRILSKSRSRFAVGYATNSSLIPIHVQDINKRGRRASLGILAYDTSFVPTPDVMRKLTEMLSEANNQLARIREKSWKIFVLDITHHPTRGNLDFYHLLANVFHEHCNLLRSIDGTALFSWNPVNTKNHAMPFSLIPTFLKEGITSRVLRQPFQLYRGLMVTMPTSMYVRRGWNNLLEINKEGYIGVDDVEYGPFWKYIELLSMINQSHVIG